MKALITACALVLTGGAAYAQTGQQPPPPPPQQPQQPPPPAQQQQEAVDVSDADIQKFAEIYIQVEEARNELTLEMNDASTPEEAQDIQARMQEEIVAAIAEHGWSVDRYNEIATAISNDPEMRSTALDLINEMTSS